MNTADERDIKCKIKSALPRQAKRKCGKDLPVFGRESVDILSMARPV